MFHLRSALGLAFVLSLSSAGCSPALDWREVRPEGGAVRLMFPCKPASQTREVALAGARVAMAMHACVAANHTYALTQADVVQPSQVGPALTELAAAAPRHLPGGDAPLTRPAAVPGMTPNPQAADVRLSGRLPDGRLVQERLVLFAHGTRVYQATMLGPRLDDEAQEQFFGTLRVTVP